MAGEGNVTNPDLDALLKRLRGHRSSDERKVVFLIGSAMSRAKRGGIPMAADIADMIRARLDGSEARTDGPSSGAASAYQQSFARLARERGPHAVQEILRSAVLQAYVRTRNPVAKSDADCRAIESDEFGWFVPRGTRALGNIIANYSDRFHDVVLTTNFDPLLPIALRLAHTPTTQTILGYDGNPAQTMVKGCHVVHLHGYWYGQDALHTRVQLTGHRPILKAYLKQLMKEYTLAIVGYSGWDDLFATAIKEVSVEQNANPDILWAIHGPPPSPADEVRVDPKYRMVMEAFNYGRVHFYYGIDCHDLFWRLYRNLEASPERRRASRYPPSQLADTAESSPGRKRYGGLLYRLRLGCDSPEATDTVRLVTPRAVSWFETNQSIVIQAVGAESPEGPGSHVIDQVWFLGPSTGSRYLALLWRDESTVEVSTLRSKNVPILSVEIPWAHDNNDSLLPCESLFSCELKDINRTRGVAARLLKERSPILPNEAALRRGVWLKVSEKGGVFVVKIDEPRTTEGETEQSHVERTLTECTFQEPRNLWRGRWALEPQSRLDIAFDHWVLTAWPGEFAGIPLNLNEWGAFSARERGTWDGADSIGFLLLHVRPEEPDSDVSTPSSSDSTTRREGISQPQVERV
jgi:hypothetical protein